MLWLPKWLREETDDAPPENPSRRRAIFLMGGAVVGAALPLPAITFPAMPKPVIHALGYGGVFGMAEALPILKEVYIPAIREHLTSASVLVRYLEAELLSNNHGYQLTTPPQCEIVYE